MARIVLVDATASTVASFEAATAGEHALELLAADAIRPGGDLYVFDLPAGARMQAAPELPVSAPVLVLCERADAIDARSFPHAAVLQKPCDLVTLRAQIRASLSPSGVAATPPTRASDAAALVLSYPFVPRPVAALLETAARFAGPVWIVGEAGTGAERIAAALASEWDPAREPVVWAEGDSLTAAASRLDDPSSVLWVPSLDERCHRDQRALERLLAVEPDRRVVVTSAAEPDSAVASGVLLRGLHQSLSRLALRLPPLRERQHDILPLASLFASRAAAAAGLADPGGFEAAAEFLQAYPWPGNAAELEAVVTRSVLARGRAAFGPIERRHLIFTTFVAATSGQEADGTSVSEPGTTISAFERPDGNAPVVARTESADLPASGRRAVVVSLAEAASGRSVRPGDAGAATSVDAAAPPRSDAASAAGIEAVLAAFAHDIRNPMVTIQTFTGLAVASPESDELARLAADACSRIETHLEFLQRYAELTSSSTPDDAKQVDLVELFGGSLDAAGASAAVEIVARQAVQTAADFAAARFIADAIVAECVARTGAGALLGAGDTSPALVDVAPDRTGLVITIPAGSAAIDRLGRWLEDAALPWRLAIARDVARRAGGDLRLDSQAGELRITWTVQIDAAAAVQQAARGAGAAGKPGVLPKAKAKGETLP